MLELEDHELRRLKRCEADQDVHDPQVDVVLRRGLTVDLDEISILRRLPLEGTLPK